jgi:hypothetical protein
MADGIAGYTRYFVGTGRPKETTAKIMLGICTDIYFLYAVNFLLLILRIKLLRNSLKNHPEIPNDTKIRIQNKKKSEFTTREANSRNQMTTAKIF